MDLKFAEINRLIRYIEKEGNLIHYYKFLDTLKKIYISKTQIIHVLTIEEFAEEINSYLK